jgi:hypothetical protein
VIETQRDAVIGLSAMTLVLCVALGTTLYELYQAEQPYVHQDTCSTVFAPDDAWLQHRLRHPQGHGSGSLSWGDSGGRRAYETEEGIPDKLPIHEPRKVRVHIIEPAPKAAP